jgi:hypothetical protein
LRNKLEIINRANVIPEEIERIKFKLFHLTSIRVLRAVISSKLRDSKLTLSKISFKGILPKTVVPSAPIQYVRRARMNTQKILLGNNLK